MIQDTLPYLIQLIRQNVILHALVVSGSWNGVNLSKLDHELIGQVLQINNFALSKEDTFEVKFFSTPDIGSKKKNTITTLMLNTRNSKYFETAAFYFNDDDNRGMNKHPVVKAMRKSKKDLGVFKIFDDPVKPAFVNIVRNPVYGYGILIKFYTDFDEV